MQFTPSGLILKLTTQSPQRHVIDQRTSCNGITSPVLSWPRHRRHGPTAVGRPGHAYQLELCGARVSPAARNSPAQPSTELVNKHPRHQHMSASLAAGMPQQQVRPCDTLQSRGVHRPMPGSPRSERPRNAHGASVVRRRARVQQPLNLGKIASECSTPHLLVGSSWLIAIEAIQHVRQPRGGELCRQAAAHLHSLRALYAAPQTTPANAR